MNDTKVGVIGGNTSLSGALTALAASPAAIVVETIKDHPDIVTSMKALREKSRPTSVQECDDLGLWDKMKYVLDTYPNATAVAAVQIGYPLRAALCRFVTREGVTEDVKLVNPKITEAFGFLTANEGCISVPGQTVTTGRSRHVVVEDDTHEVPLSLNDVCAVVVQHELDHMEGMLMFDRAVKGTVRRDGPKIGRNDPCPCKSGKKYTSCCLNAV